MGVNHPTGGGQKCGYHTHSFHIKPRVNLGAKVFSSRTESLAFVKETSFFFVRSRNIFLSVVHKFDLLIVPYHHNYLSRLSQSTHHHAFSLLVVTSDLGGAPTCIIQGGFYSQWAFGLLAMPVLLCVLYALIALIFYATTTSS